jgi:hypothetical protein
MSERLANSALASAASEPAVNAKDEALVTRNGTELEAAR